MGWGSGVEIFNAVVGPVIMSSATDPQKVAILSSLIEELYLGDWDNESDSDFLENELVQKAFLQNGWDVAEYLREIQG